MSEKNKNIFTYTPKNDYEFELSCDYMVIGAKYYSNGLLLEDYTLPQNSSNTIKYQDLINKTIEETREILKKKCTEAIFYGDARIYDEAKITHVHRDTGVCDNILRKQIDCKTETTNLDNLTKDINSVLTQDKYKGNCF